ncbi:hypothetical protein FZEAL_4434 [Fusarium zealandicum]|uniref:Uncharacterized protein n=1 Tax=Fusarium zealandicum TaxID=1053134 RepID=A0A8H4XKT4_9HYPO|nr:hypothetical protein FZEAL_4434 [Fusarium zealandicum]
MPLIPTPQVPTTHQWRTPHILALGRPEQSNLQRMGDRTAKQPGQRRSSSQQKLDQNEGEIDPGRVSPFASTPSPELNFTRTPIDHSGRHWGGTGESTECTSGQNRAELHGVGSWANLPTTDVAVVFTSPGPSEKISADALAVETGTLKSPFESPH